MACRYCDAPIVWARTVERLQPIPVDAEDMGGWLAPSVVKDGDLVPTGRKVKGKWGSVPVVRPVGSGAGEWRAHVRTCPAALRVRS